MKGGFCHGHHASRRNYELRIDSPMGESNSRRFKVIVKRRNRLPRERQRETVRKRHNCRCCHFDKETFPRNKHHPTIVRNFTSRRSLSKQEKPRTKPTPTLPRKQPPNDRPSDCSGAENSRSSATSNSKSW